MAGDFARTERVLHGLLERLRCASASWMSAGHEDVNQEGGLDEAEPTKTREALLVRVAKHGKFR